MVSANLLYESAAAARNAPAGELLILLCQHCGFVFNGAFDLRLVPYGQNYENDQSKSERFHSHMQEMAARVRAPTNESSLRVVEVGCGQGQFLRLVRSAEPTAEDRAAGFDPSYIGEGIPACDIYRIIFDRESVRALSFQPNVVISRHVIEHIPDPRDVLGTIRAALDGIPEANVFFETPCIDWIFENNAFWDLCYEHCSYFTRSSLTFAFEICGFQPQIVETVFGGQYLWMEAAIGEPKYVLPQVGDRLALRFAQTTSENQSRWREKLAAFSTENKIAVWGASTKGAMFVQDIDFEATLVHCLIDINPLKQNRYVPLTAHPVMDWQSAIADGVSTIIIANPNYAQEIKELLGQHASGVNFLSL